MDLLFSKISSFAGQLAVRRKPMAVYGPRPSTIDRLFAYHVSCHTLFRLKRIFRSTSNLGETTIELEGCRPQQKSDQLWEGVGTHTTEIHSLGNFTYSDLANLLFTKNGFGLDQLWLCPGLSADWIAHHEPHPDQDTPNTL